MPYGLYLSAAGADLQSQRMQVISNNLANVDTPGFKRDFALPEARYTEAIERGIADPGEGSLNDVSGGVSLGETVTDFSRGVYKPTGINTDFALDDDGKGFFAVERDGEEYLTRAGNFRFDNQGRLKTQDGYPVLSIGGEVVQIDPTGPAPILHHDGLLSQGGESIPLAIRRPKSLGDLVKAGATMFRQLAESEDAAPEHRQVRQGTLEMSSVKPIDATVEMIETSRVYEANIRMIQHQDGMLGSLVGRLLRV
ncbi:flagellar hook-basal body protein [Lignipirellula cremea]|uniref:Flagellar basal-body rod protein FlgG n=1 Tax=Lignipirellula cremea TaxID=2528010 RepID=A0A518DR42_9BACT|nr:flagellar hook-basal body protein [Lignipirellula cremea]QDU94305.1 Flagellar basal-body rod protein FlgG [Lignipirellula cremea]